MQNLTLEGLSNLLRVYKCVRDNDIINGVGLVLESRDRLLAATILTFRLAERFKVLLD